MTAGLYLVAGRFVRIKYYFSLLFAFIKHSKAKRCDSENLILCSVLVTELKQFEDGLDYTYMVENSFREVHCPEERQKHCIFKMNTYVRHARTLQG